MLFILKLQYNYIVILLYSHNIQNNNTEIVSDPFQAYDFTVINMQYLSDK